MFAGAAMIEGDAAQIAEGLERAVEAHAESIAVDAHGRARPLPFEAPWVITPLPLADDHVALAFEAADLVLVVKSVRLAVQVRSALMFRRNTR